MIQLCGYATVFDKKKYTAFFFYYKNSFVSGEPTQMKLHSTTSYSKEVHAYICHFTEICPLYKLWDARQVTVLTTSPTVLRALNSCMAPTGCLPIPFTGGAQPETYAPNAPSKRIGKKHPPPTHYTNSSCVSSLDSILFFFLLWGFEPAPY